MPEAGVVTWRHRRQDVPTERHHSLNPADACQRLIGGDKFATADIGLRQRKLTDDLLEPQLFGLVDDDEQHFIVKRGLRMLAIKQRIKREVTRISHFSHVMLVACGLAR